MRFIGSLTRLTRWTAVVAGLALFVAAFAPTVSAAQRGPTGAAHTGTPYVVVDCSYSHNVLIAHNYKTVPDPAGGSFTLDVRVYAVRTNSDNSYCGMFGWAGFAGSNLTPGANNTECVTPELVYQDSAGVWHTVQGPKLCSTNGASVSDSTPRTNNTIHYGYTVGTYTGAVSAYYASDFATAS